jgi:hypothetical protein
MTFGLSGAAIAGLAVGGATLASGFMSANAAENAASTAADAQSYAAQLSTQERQRQFDALQKVLAPYVNAGNGAITGQQNLLGLNGQGAQQQAINGIASSPQMQAMTQQGENAILQNASATGGLRGGNTQAALAQFRPALLSQMIQQQYQNLGGLTSVGQNAAAGVGNAGMATGNGIASDFSSMGSAQAGAALAAGQAQGQMWNSASNALMGGLGVFKGLGGKF